ncbi:MAG: ribonuclease J, partial [Desulfobacteraceae bacterium]|nr:ribonuclease J [Desulfobacteraceae bacterium]
IVSMVLDEETGDIISGPDLVSKGFVFNAATGYLVDDAQCVILEVVEELRQGLIDGMNMEILRNRLTKALKEYFNFAIKRKPMILPVITQV